MGMVRKVSIKSNLLDCLGTLWYMDGMSAVSRVKKSKTETSRNQTQRYGKALNNRSRNNSRSFHAGCCPYWFCKSPFLFFLFFSIIFLFSLNFLWEQHHPHWLKFNFLREPHTWISSAEESASTVNTSRPNCIDWTQPRPSSSRIFWAWVGWIHFSAISSSLNPCLKCD